jgi:hypothetical protein
MFPVSSGSKQKSSMVLAYLILLFDPEDGNNKLLQNIDTLLPCSDMTSQFIIEISHILGHLAVAEN